MDNSEKLAQQDEEKKSKNNTICLGHYHTQTSTNNANKTCTLLQTTGGKDEPNITFMRKS